MWQSVGPQADSLSLHRDRYGAPERNVGLAESGPIGTVRNRGFYARLRC